MKVKVLNGIKDQLTNYIHVRSLRGYMQCQFLTNIFIFTMSEKKMLNIIIFLELVLGLKLTLSCHQGQQEALETLEKQKNYMSRFLYINTFEY